MSVLREIASLGRSARAEAKLKVRLPLAQVEVVLSDDSQIEWLRTHDALIREELNVKAVDYTTEADQYVQYSVVPNFKRLGPKVGKQIPALKQALAEADGNELFKAIQQDGRVSIDVGGQPIELDREDIEVRLQARAGWAAAQGPRTVVVLNTEVTDELRREGIAKDIIRVVQNQRKAMECQYLDRIEVLIQTEDGEAQNAITQYSKMIANETLADSVKVGAVGEDAVEMEFGKVSVNKVDNA